MRIVCAFGCWHQLLFRNRRVCVCLCVVERWICVALHPLVAGNKDVCVCVCVSKGLFFFERRLVPHLNMALF